jgi:hypothetical protein
MKITWIKILLIASGIYDAVIGAAFLVGGSALFRTFHVTPPNHDGYIRFPAQVLIIFAVMFLRAAADPVARRDVLLYGAALKLSYFSLVFWYQFRGGVPSLWIPFAWADVVFFALFVLGWRSVAKISEPARQTAMR